MSVQIGCAYRAFQTLHDDPEFWGGEESEFRQYKRTLEELDKDPLNWWEPPIEIKKVKADRMRSPRDLPTHEESTLQAALLHKPAKGFFASLTGIFKRDA